MRLSAQLANKLPTVILTFVTDSSFSSMNNCISLNLRHKCWPDIPYTRQLWKYFTSVSPAHAPGGKATESVEAIRSTLMESEWGTHQWNRRRQTNKQRAQSNHASHRPSPRGDQAICVSVRLYNGSPSKQEIANIALIRRGKTQNALMDVSRLALCTVCMLEFCV